MINNALLKVLAHLQSRMADDSDRGATMVEYGLLVGVVVIIIAGGAVTFGNTISTWFSTVAGEITGFGSP
ncbi:Flp family type IVb pilin [Thermomonospora umbrina]|uniref:Pilus assembly protein Flp/PilA n=1 Tax=Thermomonospora umbrina TaxID=111806 RepID=A0A3D9SQN8_9ACTN|nr:Flp family type IVb pilin [Thermomonospora umbrina]REE96810.1 pilus assembly protein Flp/PilA [Thermomonospora umbrina]